MIKILKTTQALAFILNVLLARNTLAQQNVRGITHNDLKRVEVEKSDPFFEATVQANFEFCESIPGFISELLCAYVPLFEKICSDNCGSAEDDDDDDNNTTSVSLNAIMQQEERLDEMVQANFEFCESLPSFIAELLCAYVPPFHFFCSDVCGIVFDDDDASGTSPTPLPSTSPSASLSRSNILSSQRRGYELGSAEVGAR